MKKKYVFLVLALMLIITGCGSDKVEGPEEVTATFEKVDSIYVLKDDKGNVLIDNIKRHGEFCNGTTYIETEEGKAIINGSGKFVAEYGEYSSISQFYNYSSPNVYHCFYEVRDNTPAKKYLKYDGTVLFEDADDRYLSNTKLLTYTFSNHFAILDSKEKYEIVNYLGEKLFTIDKVSGDDKIIVQNGASRGSNVFATIYYNNKTYVYRIRDMKQILAVDGYFNVNDAYDKEIYVNDVLTTSPEEYFILMDRAPGTNELRKIYVIDQNGKILFEKDNYVTAFFLNGNIRCVSGSSSSNYDYYDLKGNQIEQP